MSYVRHAACRIGNQYTLRYAIRTAISPGGQHATTPAPAQYECAIARGNCLVVRSSGGLLGDALALERAAVATPRERLGADAEEGELRRGEVVVLAAEDLHHVSGGGNKDDATGNLGDLGPLLGLLCAIPTPVWCTAHRTARR